MAQHGQFKKTLTTPKIVFLVIAAAAPLAAMVGTAPLAFAIGDGAGFPGMFVFAGLTLLCFSVGYAAMSRRVVNTGGFYSYLSIGLGRPAAVAGGLVAVVSYNAVTIGLVGAFGYFAHIIAQSHGLDISWEVWSAGAILAMAVFGYRQIEMNARVLSVLLVGEISILLLLDGAILLHKGFAALPTTSFHPATVLSSGAGVAMMFAFISYIGFEVAALYGEESQTPRRSVPLATYFSVIVITLFFAVTSWTAVGAIGADKIRNVAGNQLGNLFFSISSQQLGSIATDILQVLLCTSLFGAILALHNASNRYVFALGRDRVLPSSLAGVHGRFSSPHRASLAQTILTIAVVSAFAVAGLNPYLNLATSMLGVGTLGIVVLQAGAALSVVFFFRTRADRHWWRTGLAPLLGLAGLVVSTVLLVENFSVLTGTHALVVTALPEMLAVVAVIGFGYAMWMRSVRPDRYAGLAVIEIRGDAKAVTVGSVPHGEAAAPTPEHVEAAV